MTRGTNDKSNDTHNQRTSTTNNVNNQATRRRLQRGAKDKVYAERLMAAGDEGIVHDTNSNQQQRDKKRRSSGGGVSLTSKGQSKDRVMRVQPPPNWPFGNSNDNSSGSGGKVKGDATMKRGTKRTRKMSTGGTSSNAAVHTATNNGYNQKSETKNGNVSKQPEILSTRSRSKRRIQPSDHMQSELQRGGDGLKQPYRKKGHDPTTMDATSTIPSNQSIKSTSTTSSTTTRRSRSKTTPTRNASNTTTNKWACGRCTLFNSSRRKKCEVCGALRTIGGGIEVENDNGGCGSGDLSALKDVTGDGSATKSAVAVKNGKADSVDDHSCLNDGEMTSIATRGLRNDVGSDNQSASLPKNSLQFSGLSVTSNDGGMENDGKIEHLECKSVTVHLTVCSERVCDDPTSTRCSNDGETNTMNDGALTAFVSTSFISQGVKFDNNSRGNISMESERLKRSEDVPKGDHNEAMTTEQIATAENHSANGVNDDTLTTEQVEGATINDDETDFPSASLSIGCPIQSSGSSIPVNDSGDGNGMVESLEHQSVTVRLTVCSERIRHDATLAGSGNDGGVNTMNDGVLTAILPTAVVGRLMEQCEHGCNNSPLHGEETVNETSNEEATTTTTNEVEHPYYEHPQESQSQSQSQTSIQSELSALIDEAPSSSCSSTSAVDAPTNVQNDTLPRKEQTAEVCEKSQQEEVVASQLSQLSVQSELSAMIDATSVQKKQHCNEEEISSLEQRVQSQEEQYAQHSGNDQIACDHDDDNSNDVQQEPLPPPLDREDTIDTTQQPSNLRALFKRRRDSRREKKRRRNRSNGINETVDVLTDENNQEQKTVHVRLILSDTVCDDTELSTTLLADVPTSVFPNNDNENDCINNINSLEELNDAIRDNGHDHRENIEEKRGSALQLGNEEKNGSPVKVNDEGATTCIPNNASSVAEDAHTNDTHERRDIDCDSTGRGTSPLCETNIDEQCASTQGSSSFNQHIPMTQQQPDFDYFTQPSNDQRSGQFPYQSQNEEVEDGSSLYTSYSESYRTKQYLEYGSNDKRVLEKENISASTPADYEVVNDVVGKPLQLCQNTEQDNREYNDTNLKNNDQIFLDVLDRHDTDADDTLMEQSVANYDDKEPFEMPPSTGLGFVSVGSRKTIAVSEEALAKGDKLLATNTESIDQNGTASNEPIVDDDDDYDDEEPFEMPPSTGLGFVSVGSRKTIAVSEEALSKGNKLLANKNESIDQNETVINEPVVDDDYDDEEPFELPPSTGLGFVSVGSRMTIAVSEQVLNKGNKLLANKNESIDQSETSINEPVVDDDYDDEEPFEMPPSTGLGFVSVGSRKTIAVSEEALAKGDKLLANNTGVLNCPETVTNEPVVDDDYDDEEPFEMPPSTGLGFVSVGSRKTIAVSEEALAKGDKLLANNSDIISCNGNGTGEVVDCNISKPSSFAHNHQVTSASVNEIVHGDEFLINSSNAMNSLPSSVADLCEINSVKETSNKMISREDAQSIDFPAMDESKTFKNTSKVRFSLDGQPSCRLKGNNGSSLDSILPRAGAVDNQSLFTPAKMSGAHNDPRVENLGQDPSSHSNSTNPVHIVTEHKDKDTSPNVLGGEAHSSSSPQYYSNVYTPLNLVNRRDSLQSEIKSKRLFQRTPATKKTLSNSRLSDNASDAIDTSNSTKVTMRELAERCGIETEWDNCKDAGVPEVVLKITSANATKLRFSQDEGLPLFFLGQSDFPTNVQIRKSDDVYDWLVDEGFDQTLFSKKWVHNHYRWIVWKLGSMERRFPSQLSGMYLTYHHILLQIKSRFEKELINAKRPSVRKILNRDVSSGMPIILCVAQILRFRTKEGGLVSEEIRLELTDGWYGLQAAVDKTLESQIANGKIRAGSKLFICNAQIVGSEDGVDPLDEGYSSEKRNCPLILKITANNTRLAKWDAKLGFTSPRSGGIRIKSLRDIYPGGGNIPSINLIVCKRYPKMYLEQLISGDGQVCSTTHLTENEEMSQRNEHEMKKQRAGETYVDECAKELDEDAPSKWKQMMISNSPEDYYENMSLAERRIVDDWNKRRPVLLQNMLSKFVADTMGDASSLERRSKPYIKTLVKTFHRNEMSTTTQPLAALTVWGVSDDMDELLREGAVLHMKNLGVKEKSREGLLQLSAGPKTKTEPLSEDSRNLLLHSGYEIRRPKSLIKINLIAKKVESDRLSNEIDVVACVAKIRRLGDNSTCIYLTDESGLVFNITRNHDATNNDPFHLGNSNTNIVVSFCNIQITDFDEIAQCANGTWGLFSCKSNRNRVEARYEELDAWCHSQLGADAIGAVCARLDAGIPIIGGLSNRHHISIGYIVSLLEGDDFNPHVIKAAIDYGEETLLVAEFPLHLIKQTVALLQNTAVHNLSPGSWDVSVLSDFFQNNLKLLHFSLEAVSCYGGDSPTLQIKQVSLANVNALSLLIMS